MILHKDLGTDLNIDKYISLFHKYKKVIQKKHFCPPPQRDNEVQEGGLLDYPSFVRLSVRSA